MTNDYLIKEFETVYKSTANFHVLETKDVVKNADKSLTFPRVEFRAYASLEAYQASGKLVDNFQARLAYTITDEEIKSQPDEAISDKITRALLNKIVTSVPDEHGNETNKFNGNAGDIDYIEVLVE